MFSTLSGGLDLDLVGKIPAALVPKTAPNRRSSVTGCGPIGACTCMCVYVGLSSHVVPPADECPSVRLSVLQGMQASPAHQLSRLLAFAPFPPPFFFPFSVGFLAGFVGLEL
ncbi:hypothetical protein Vafri_9250 [Volvox africanus]|uniref:Uncharacterized protein n=1 Tax=Volvox africanus TaxID=51714 RepID=A0A8J4EZJ0_9CHLO|nr:hypothetical protein Vafri_9250 [Volvox africanus]